MIRVVHSNRVEELADALAQALPAPGDPSGLFEGPWLIVPTRPLTLWLNLQLAQRRGIAGHVDTMTFDGMFARLTAESQPEVVLIERGHVVGELLGLLADDGVMSAAALAPLASYLRAAGDEPAAVDRRRVDLAQALGRLFDEWALLRPEALRTWRLPGAAEAPDAPPLERAERAVFAALFGAGGRFARRGAAEGRRYLTRDAFLEAGLAANWRPPAAVHVFAPHDVSPGVQLTLARLGQRTDVRLYAINPCREFWEDLETGAAAGAAVAATPALAPAVTAPPPGGRSRTRGRSVPADPRQLDLLAPAASAPLEAPLVSPGPVPDPTASATGGRENPWLAAWGRGGRELVSRLNALTDQTFEFRAVEPPGGTLLAQVQQDILERRPRREGGARLAREADGSIVVLGAPNPRREIESVAAEIWRLIRADAARAAGAETGDEPLRFSDIAVLVAGPPEPHLSLVPEVFHEAEELPHTIVDRGFGARSGLADAVLALASLPLGALTRREVLDVVTHANIRARFPDADPGAWLKLCEALTIAHGADHRAHAGTYIDRDAFNWDQGCRRLVLGRFARGPRSGAEEPLVLPAPVERDTALPDAGYSPAEVGAELRDDADALGALMRSLLADVGFARAAHLTVPEWMRFVRALMTAYVVPVTPEDEGARLAVLAALHQLATQCQDAAETTVSLAVAVELLRTALGELRGARGQMLGAGVVVGTLATLRALPARVVFVLGLEPRRFPSARGPAPLDVLAGSGGAAELSARDTDRSLFLEATVAARDRLILTTTDRDPLTGEPVEPSSVVLDLLDELGRGYVRDPAALVRQVPLHRDEDPDVCAAFPTAAAEAQARLLGEAARRAAAAGADEPAALVRGLAPAAREALGPLLGLISPAGDPGGAESAPPVVARRERTTLSFVDLRRFLECPLQGSARVFLGLRDLPDDSDARETTDEPFDLPRSMERALLNEVLLASWTTADVPDAATLALRYDEATARYRAAHRLPVALFRRNVRRRHLHILGQWAEQVTTAGRLSVGSSSSFLGPPRRVCFGRPEPYALHAERRPALRIAVDVPSRGAFEVELQGTTEPLVWLGSPAAAGSPPGEATLVFATSSYEHNNDCDSFRALIDIMAMAATAPEGAPPVERRAYVFRPTRLAHEKLPRPHVLAFPSLNAAAARAYLARLCTALLSGVHGYLFPCDAVLRASRKGVPVTEGIEQTRLDAYYRSRSASNRGPVPDPFDYPGPAEEDAARFRDERFGPLLEALAAPGRSGDRPPEEAGGGEGELARVIPFVIPSGNGAAKGSRRR